MDNSMCMQEFNSIANRLFEEWFSKQYPSWKEDPIGVFNNDLKIVSKRAFFAGAKAGFNPYER